MKTIATISLIIFAIIITAVLAAGLVLREQNLKNNQPLELNQNVSSTPPNSSTNSSNSLANNLILNSSEIIKHNNSLDCWLIINNKVYNVTNFLFVHPGGASTMIPYCGKDATVAFNTKDLSNPKPHSQNAQQLLSSYYIGNLNQSVSSTTIQNSSNTAAPASINSENESEGRND